MKNNKIFYISIICFLVISFVFFIFSTVLAKEKEEVVADIYEGSILDNEMYSLMKKGTFDVNSKTRLKRDTVVYYVGKTEDGLYKYKEVNTDTDTENYLYNYTFFEVEDLSYLEALYLIDFNSVMTIKSDVKVKDTSPVVNSIDYIEKKLKKDTKVEVLNLVEGSKSKIYAKIKLSNDKIYYVNAFYLNI